MWDFFEPKDNQWYRWDLNGASAFLHKQDDAWQILFRQIAFQDVNDSFGGPYLAESPDSDDTAISFAVGKGKKAALQPFFYGIPYLATVQTEITILPGAETCFKVILPPHFRFELSPHETFLAEKMPFTLSRTWYGDSMSGILCQSLPFLLRPQCGEKDFSQTITKPSSLIHCELLVRNTSKTPVNFKQAVIYTEMLNIYEKNDCLLTDTIVLDSGNDGNLNMNIQYQEKNKEYKKLSSSMSRGAVFLKAMTIN